MFKAPELILEQDSIIATSKDTIKLRIRASDKTLKKGTIDFNDGTIITLNNLSKNIDTTITHNYKNNGSFLAIVTFDDGFQTTNKLIKIDIKYYFSFNFEVGMKWKFRHIEQYYNRAL